MPVDRLKRFLERLERFGLITTGRPFDGEDQEGTRYLLTPRGQEFLDTYWKMKGFLDVFGEG
jgi:predicted transcriptional regulator